MGLLQALCLLLSLSVLSTQAVLFAGPPAERENQRHLARCLLKHFVPGKVATWRDAVSEVVLAFASASLIADL